MSPLNRDRRKKEINLSVSEQYIITTVRIPKKIKKLLEEEAKKENKSVSQLVTEILNAYFEEGQVNYKLLIEEYKKELNLYSTQYKNMELTNRALKREIKAYKQQLKNYSLMINTLLKEAKEAKKIKITYEHALKLERTNYFKAKELEQKEKELTERERQLKEFEKYLAEKEERLLKVEQLIKTTKLEKQLPKFVEEYLTENEMKAVGRDELQEITFYVFTDDEFKAILEKYEVINTNHRLQVRKVNDRLLYKHHISNILKGYFELVD